MNPLISHWPEVYRKEIEVLFKYSRLEIRVLSVRKKGSKCVCGGGWVVGSRGEGAFGVATLVSARVYTQQLTLSISLMPLVTGIISGLKT